MLCFDNTGSPASRTDQVVEQVVLYKSCHTIISVPVLFNRSCSSGLGHVVLQIVNLIDLQVKLV